MHWCPYEPVHWRVVHRSCVSRPAIGEETKVTIDIAGELFTARGLMVLEKVWLDVYTYDNWSGNAAMPTFHEVCPPAGVTRVRARRRISLD